MPTNEGEPLTNEQIDNDSVNPTSITRVKLKKAIADSLQQSESTGEDLSETANKTL